MIRCFYHSADLDGHCSGAIVKYKYPDAELYGINYGHDFPYDKIDIEKDTIIMVDFSLQPFTKMVELFQKLGDRLIVIDHHVSAIHDLIDGDLNDKIPGLRINGIAGCELTWTHFFPEKEMPEVVRLLGRYDVWDHQPNVLEFQYGMRLNNTWPENQVLWKQCFENLENNDLEDFINTTIKKGTIILEYQKQENEKYCKSCAFEVDFNGYKAICVNKLLTSSQLFESVWDENKYDLMITFGVRKDGLWTMSFYTTKSDVDCTQIAKSFGGGGHKQAAGCKFEKLPYKFIKQIESKRPIEFEELPDYGDHFTINEFIDYIKNGVFTDYDGTGYYAKEDKMTRIEATPSLILNGNIDGRWSHVIWFNK